GHRQRRYRDARSVVRHLGAALHHQSAAAARATCGRRLQPDPASSARACVAEADVVVTITNSAKPVCRAEWLAEGVHVNVAGANSHDRREVDAETVLRAAVKATDHIEQAKDVLKFYQTVGTVDGA